MIQINDKAECVGCSACVAVCPRNCIEMKEDREGFLYPKVRKSQCIHCGLCEKVCPTKKFYPSRKEPLYVYAAINNSDTIRERSSSGGVFYSLAEYIIKHNGIVYGAVFDENWEVHHIGIEVIEDISLMQGAKYVQSRMENCCREVECNLQAGRLVLFSGTPCQNAGLRSFLRKDYNNLFCIDIICHGVPSPKVWRHYLRVIEKRYGKTTDRNLAPVFRSKVEGWNNYSLVISVADGRKYCKKANEDLYLKTYLQDVFLRPACYQCHFKPSVNHSDIVIADFWGIEDVSMEMFDDKGTSLVIINTDKGREVFDKIKDEFKYKEELYTEAIKGNPSAISSVRYRKDRRWFFVWLNIGKSVEWVMKWVNYQTAGRKSKVWLLKHWKGIKSLIKG